MEDLLVIHDVLGLRIANPNHQDMKDAMSWACMQHWTVRAWSYMSVIPALRMERQDNWKVEGILSFAVSLKQPEVCETCVGCVDVGYRAREERGEINIKTEMYPYFLSVPDWFLGTWDCSWKVVSKM